MSEEKKKGTILIIDDHPFFGTNLKYKLKKYGYEVATAEDGMNGIIQAKRLKPDIIFIDYIMPGMDGIETCEKLHSDPDMKGSVLIIYTSEAYSGIVNRAIQAGAKDFITKTTNFETILQKIQKLMEQKGDGA
jgi:two-component system, OmpR family, alkaline phosphatase synthesis response regulator PhoP